MHDWLITAAYAGGGGTAMMPPVHMHWGLRLLGLAIVVAIVIAIIVRGRHAR